MKQGMLKQFFKGVLLWSLLAAPAGGSAWNDGEALVVTAQRAPRPVDQVGSAVTVLEGDDLDPSRGQFVADVLQQVPGLSVVRTGGAGQVTSVFLRGTNFNQVLVLLDGVVMNDPVTGAFNFATLSLDAIERIEIIRGPQSTLYGSRAIGGVIQIFTKTAATEGMHAVLGVEAGSFGTGRIHVGGGQRGDYLGWTLHLTHLETEGISAAACEHGNREKDGFRNRTATLRLDGRAGDRSSYRSLLRLNEGQSDIDNFGGAGGDDPNHETEVTEVYWLGEWQRTLNDDRFDQVFSLHYTLNDFSVRNDPDPAHPFETSRGTFKGRRWRGSFLQQAELGDHMLTLGIEGEEETAKASTWDEFSFGTFTMEVPQKSVTVWSALVQDVWQAGPDTVWTLGGRYDDHEFFGGEGTLRLTVSHGLIPEAVRLKGSLGSGFRAPTLFQLFSPFGNRDLDAETSVGLDGGFEWTLDEHTRTGVTVFWSDIEQLIEFDGGTGAFMNRDEARMEGVEIFAERKLSEKILLAGNYTYLDARNLSADTRLLRRPRHQGLVSLDYRPTVRDTLRIEGHYLGERDDLDFGEFPARRVVLDDYQLWAITLSRALSEQARVYCRVENFLDEDYEEVLGFGTPGRAFTLGGEFRI